MAHSSLLGTERAAATPKGRDVESLGPSDLSDSGSDMVGADEGALADLILVDGNPLENLDLVAYPDRNFKIIMKDGRILKDTLAK